MAEFEKAAVKPFYEDAPLDIDFQKRLKSVVVTDLDMLEKICNQENKIVAFDTETTGLVYYKDHIVGCSMSFNGESGFYVPLRHEQPDGTPATFNLPIKESLHLIYEKLLKRNQVILYNSCFDLTMIGQELDKIGVDFTDIENVKFLDAQCLVYFLEPEIKKNGLKWAARHFLGRISPEFLQVLGVTKKSIKTKGKHFGHINPWQEVTIEPQFIELKGAKKKLTEADVLHNSDMLEIGTYTTTGAIYAVCHDDQTEVLTSSGWVRWSEYSGITPLATVNLETDLIEYQEPIGLTKYHYEGDMVHYKAKALDFCVTPNHRMLVYKAQNKAKGVIKKEIKDFNMYEKLYYQPKGKASGNNFELLTSQGVLLNTNQVAKLTALVLADGWVRSRSEKSRGYQVGVALSKYKNYEEIKTFLKSLGLRSNFYRKTNITESWIISDKNIWDLLRPCCEGGSRGKYIPDFIKAMSSSDLSDFIHFYNMTDGSTHNGVHQLFTTSTRMKDDLQEVLLLTGRHSCIYTRKPKDAYIGDRLIAKENCADLYFLYFSDKKQSVGVTRDTSRGNWKNIAYNGYVYCAEVPNHTLITRRNGKILISGNCDSSNTYALYEKLCPVVQDMQMQHNKTTLDPFAFVTDSRLAKAMLHYKHTPISIDSKLMGNFLEDVENQIEETETKIFEIAGKPFNISSTPQKREIFQSLGINTGVETKTGMSVSVSALANVNHPIVDLLTKRSHLEKRRSAYFEPLSKEQISRINYKTCAVATGRLASGKGNEIENTYFSSISVQTLPKSKMCLYEAVYVGENNSDPENILGYKFHPVTPTYAEGNPDKIYVEGFSQELNVRNSLCAPHHIYVETPTEKLDFGFDIIKAENYIRANNLEPERLICEKSNDWYVCSLDISAEELAIIANLSKEPNFIEPLLQRADLHRYMAQKMFPEFDSVDKATQKNLRKKAKSGNFGLAYRGSHLALRDIESEEEQLKIYNAWWSNMPIYRQWQQERINEMMMFTEGDAINHYGRKRRFKHLLTTGRQSDTNSAIRAACNHYVQGLGADYIRICMGRFYEEILKENKNFNEIRFVASIHDELAFAIRKDVLDKWLFKVMTIMETSYPQEFIVPFISNAQIGPTFGFGFDFDYERDPETFKLIEGSKLRLRV